MSKISLKNLSHSYLNSQLNKEDWALRNVNIDWNDGGAYALLGPSGCGKTTLLNIISGLLNPTEGQILFNDVDVTNKNPVERNIAQIFQFPVIYDTMTVFDNLAFPLKNRGISEQEIKNKVEEIAEMLELTSTLHNRASGLTADGKQKISLGRGLVRSDVNVIMFDEPLTVIDPHLKWILRSKLKELHQKINRTMIYVTHDQTEALTFADQVVVMHDAEIVQIGAISINGNMIETKIDIKDKSFSKTEVGIRPEFIEFNESGLPVKILKVSNTGRHKIIDTESESGKIKVIAKSSTNIPTGSAFLNFKKDYTYVYGDNWIIE